MTFQAGEATSLIQTIRNEYPATDAIHIGIGDCTIECRTNSKELIKKLERYFNEFITAPSGNSDILITAHEAPVPEMTVAFSVKQPDPGKTKIKEEWADLADGRIVRKRLTGMHFIFTDTDHCAVGPCLENDNQVINFINNRFLERKLNEGCLLGHAAGIVHNGKGLALAGFSGMGKSTLALHLMSKGTVFLSNDRVLVQDTGSMPTLFGIPKQPRINPGTALNNTDLCNIVSAEDKERFLALPTSELWQLEHKYDAIIEECYGKGRFVLQAPMNALVILNWTRTGEPITVHTVNPRERTDLLPAFMKATGLFYRPNGNTNADDPDAQAYAEVLSRTELIEICGGVDFDKASDVLLAYLETGIL